MKSSDIVLSLIIILVYIGLLLFNILSVGITKVNNNWDKYRCSPAVIPFASLFGHDTSENMTYCIQTMQAGHMDTLMGPFSDKLDVMGGITTQFNETLGNVTGVIGKIRMWVTNLMQTILSVFMNIVIQFQRILYNLKDVLSKVSALMTVFMNMITSTADTMESLWAGPPGSIVRSLCFAPNTVIELNNGERVTIKDMPLNAKLKNGTVVQSVMKISNKDKNGKQVEKMYTVDGGLDNKKIIVSGSHLIYHPEKKTFIKVKDSGDITNLQEIIHEKHEVLYCLITSDHTIPIGNWIFHDWEDNNGSPSKSLV